MEPADARRILADAELIHSAEAVTAAIEYLAAAITGRLENAHPLVLTVMGGAVVFGLIFAASPAGRSFAAIRSYWANKVQSQSCNTPRAMMSKPSSSLPMASLNGMPR